MAAPVASSREPLSPMSPATAIRSSGWESAGKGTYATVWPGAPFQCVR